MQILHNIMNIKLDLLGWFIKFIRSAGIARGDIKSEVTLNQQLVDDLLKPIIREF